MSRVSAGLVNVTNLTVTGSQTGAVNATNLTAENVTATTLNSNNFSFNNNLDVSGNLSVDGTTSLATMNVSGTSTLAAVNVSGATTLAATSVRGPLTTPAGFSVDVSSNVVVAGNATLATMGVSGASTLAATSVTGPLTTPAGFSVDVSSNVVVAGTSTLKTTSVTGPLTTPAGFSVDVSSNTVVKGTFNQPLFNTTSRMMQTGVPTSQDLYATGANNIDRWVRPIIELNTDVNIRIFADASNATVADAFVANARSVLPASGSLMYYDTPGTNTYPIDGTAGTSLYTAIPNVIGTPLFADITDTSAYKMAIKKIYSRAPVVTDPSGNVGGGSPQQLHYSTYNDSIFSYDGMQYSCDKVGLYFASRGWELPAPQYIPTNPSGVPDDLNDFIYFNRANSVTHSIEFLYGANKIIPSNVLIQYSRSTGTQVIPTTKYIVQPLQAGGLVDQSSNRCVIPSINITVTTDPTVHGRNIANGVNSAYYNIVSKMIDIIQTVPSVFTTTQGITGIIPSYTAVHTMTSFSGTFAILKKDLSVYTLNGNTSNGSDEVHPFISCSPNDPAAFIVQVSPTVSMATDMSINGTRLAGFPYVYNQAATCDPTTNTLGFSGQIYTKNGYGNPGYVTRAIYNSTFNSYMLNENQGTTIQTSGKQIGNNPYSNLYNYLAGPHSSVTEWSNAVFKQFGRTLAYDMWETIPEQIALYDSSYYLPPTPYTVDTGILLHEHHHTRQNAYGLDNYFVNVESDAALTENDGQRYLESVAILFSRTSAVPTLPTHLYGQMRGYYPLTRCTNLTVQNLLANPFTIGWTTNAAVVRTVNGLWFSQYGESDLYLFIQEKYDPLNQIMRRYYEIVNAVEVKYLADNGALCTGGSIGNSGGANFSINNQMSKFCYSQAVYDVTGQRMETLITDYYISACFLRNNSGIPVKYQYPFPWWVTGSTNQAGPSIAADGYAIITSNLGTTSLNLVAKTTNFWTDLDRSIPYAPDRNGWRYQAGAGTASTGNQNSLSWMDGKTYIPYWPRNIAGGDEKEFSLGSWTRDASGYSGYFNYDASGSAFTYNSAPYLTTKTYYVEDMAGKCFILPVAGGPNLGVTTNNQMQSVSVTVNRGSWDLAVVQYVPDASGVGSWTQLPSSGNVTQVDVSGVWVDGSGEIVSGIPTSFVDVSGAEVTTTFDLSGFTVQQVNGYYYYPKLVCVNRGMYDFGMVKNIYPQTARYTGKITLSATFV
jgi:hypothetical protein